MSDGPKVSPPRVKWSVEDYIEAEKKNEVRHEYVQGDLYAMAGASEEHNFISGNLFAALRAHLKGKPCKVFIHDMKVKLNAQVTLFYYPDVMVVCDSEDDERYFKTKPRIVVEVISDSTRDTDTREKLITFIQMPSLEEYVLVEQSEIKITVHRRSNEWRAEELVGADATLKLDSIGFQLPLREVYEGVFSA